MEAEMKRIAIFGGAFDPPGLHHRAIAQAVAATIDEVLVVPSGPRKDKVELTPARVRLAMCYRTFLALPKVRIDEQFMDRYVPTIAMIRSYGIEDEFSLVVGSDLIAGGRNNESTIQKTWYYGSILWELTNFIIVPRDGYPLQVTDLPPSAKVIFVNTHGASTDIRELVQTHQPYEHLVTPGVAALIRDEQLYQGEA